MNVKDGSFGPPGDPRGLVSVHWLGQGCHLFSVTKEICRAQRDVPVEHLIWNSRLGQGLTLAGNRPVYATPLPRSCHWLCLPVRMWELPGVCALSVDTSLLGVTLTLSSQGPCRD